MKIVTLSTYPYSQPFHGGQRRLAAIAQTLRDAGHEVFALPLFFPVLYPDHTSTEALTGLPNELRDQILGSGRREDLHLPELLGADVPAIDMARRRLCDIQPDVIHIEQPWLFPLLDILLETLPTRDRVAVVYGSQNVESVLLPDRLRAQGSAIETAAVQRADMVVAVSPADAQALADMRAPGQGSPVVLAPNGCWSPEMNSDLPRPFDEKYVLMVGSGHPPNAEGYWDVIGKIPGCIPPDARLVVAGDVGHLLQQDPRFGHFRRLNDHLVHIVGRVSEAALQGLLAHASGILLPIKTGGGTNLKTAEALLTLKPVIAMRPAFRGFEEAMTLGGVHVAQTETEFHGFVRQLFTGNLAGGLTGGRSAADVERYTWPAMLDALPAAYARLADNPL